MGAKKLIDGFIDRGRSSFTPVFFNRTTISKIFVWYTGLLYQFKIQSYTDQEGNERTPYHIYSNNIATQLELSFIKQTKKRKTSYTKRFYSSTKK